MGLDPARRFVLWVHSALSPTPEPPEPVLVRRWIEALRSSDDRSLRDLGVLVRPHPERLKEWAGVSLDGFDNVVFHGRNPIDPHSKNDYFDALYYSSAVVGLVTSAFLEAAIVGRPVLTFTLPEYRMHQQEMIHFRYLAEVEGGLLRMAPDLATHFRQLAEAVALDGARDERNRRFLTAFVRPLGLDAPATPAFADALERLHREGTTPDPSLERSQWLRPLVLPLAAWSRVGAGRWLMNDMRADAWDERAEYTERAVRERIAAKEKHKREKAIRRVRRQRRDAIMRRGKAIKRGLRGLRGGVRRLRHRTAVTVYRALYVTRLWRGELPGDTGKS
jgi:hypothetical protein